jgi:hypothetical protein
VSQTSLTLLTLLSAALLAVAPACATTYRWVDKDGKVQYSDVMPPTQAGKGHVELDKYGRVIKEQRRSLKTPEEVEQERQAIARQKALKRQQQEQQRRDKALLSTYTSEKEIELARDRAIELESLNIRGLQTRMDSAAQKLAEANAKLAISRNEGKPASASILQMRDEAQRELAHISVSMNQRTQAVEDIHLRFEADLKRFLELKAANR